jgi:ATP-dependent helicase/nuclease subunit B
MAVQFVLGRSGTGKTTYCIKAIVNSLLDSADNQPLIFLVPEQATYQAERAILSDERIAGYNRLNVLSFDRLRFLLLGKNTARPGISRIGQQMIIHRILRDSASRLQIFGPSANWPGLNRQIARTVVELHQYAKTPDDIDRLLGELGKDERNNLTVLKFADIGLILKEYLNFIEGRFIDPDVQLIHACRAVSAASFVKGAKLWVDGFADFTVSELTILIELLKVASEVWIALCLDPSDIDLENPDIERIDPIGLFNPTQRTYIQLFEMIKKCKLPLAEPVILEETVRFSDCPQLYHIERNIFESQYSKINASGNIRIVSAPNARAEVQFVVKQIQRLVKESGLRYRDIAVIASDIDSYEHYIKAYFEDYGVPYFIDKRKLLNQHPVVQLICSALEVVVGDFSTSDILAYLKTDLIPIDRYDVDQLENYCLAFDIQGSDWQGDSRWHFAAEDNGLFDEQYINLIRQKVIGPLLELRQGLCSKDGSAETISAEQFTRIVFDFLDSVQVRETLGAWIKEAAERGFPQGGVQRDYAAVNEHRQFYDKLLSIFDELCEVFAGHELFFEDYLAILNSVFSQLTLAFIPPTFDQVLVGSIERSRHPDLKAVFLIGTTQRQFPVPVTFDSILTEDDRNAAESAEFPLAATASQRLAERQYLAYIAFTRPCQFLCITYPVVDEKGSAIPRSQFIADVETLFENLTEESIEDEKIDIEQVNNEIELSELLCSRLGKDTQGVKSHVKHDSEPPVKLGAKYLELNDQLISLLSDVCIDEQFAELGSRVVSAVNYDNRACLDGEVVENLSGHQITSSATRLSTFAACPYQYFARYILELKEREEFKLEPLDVGLFYHQVLDGLLKRFNSDGIDFITVKDEQLLKLLREQIAKLVVEDSFLSNFARHSMHNNFIIHSTGQYLEDCVLAIAEMVRAGSFQPRLSEVSFGPDDSKLGKYELSLPDGRLLSLNGKIDRLDIMKLNNERAAIIFDYKRRPLSFNWSQFYYGLDMQLPIYMLAIRNATGSKVNNPVGAFYMPVEVTPATKTLSDISDKSISFGYKAKGIFNGEFAQQLDRQALKDSRFYNFYVTKDGQPYGIYEGRGALRPNDFEIILKFTEDKIIRLAGEILSGKIGVCPYRLSGKSPCGYCKYKPVCRFDWQVNDYNFLESLSKKKCLEKIGTQANA